MLNAKTVSSRPGSQLWWNLSDDWLGKKPNGVEWLIKTEPSRKLKRWRTKLHYLGIFTRPVSLKYRVTRVKRTGRRPTTAQRAYWVYQPSANPHWAAVCANRGAPSNCLCPRTVPAVYIWSKCPSAQRPYATSVDTQETTSKCTSTSTGNDDALTKIWHHSRLWTWQEYVPGWFAIKSVADQGCRPRKSKVWVCEHGKLRTNFRRETRRDKTRNSKGRISAGVDQSNPARLAGGLIICTSSGFYQFTTSETSWLLKMVSSSELNVWPYRQTPWKDETEIDSSHMGTNVCLTRAKECKEGTQATRNSGPLLQSGSNKASK